MTKKNVSQFVSLESFERVCDERFQAQLKASNLNNELRLEKKRRRFLQWKCLRLRLELEKAGISIPEMKSEKGESEAMEEGMTHD